MYLLWFQEKAVDEIILNIKNKTTNVTENCEK